MQVATGTGCARSLVCGYHGWTYALDGRLRHVPHDDAFPDLDRATRGLVEVPAVEQDGLMLVRLDGPGADAPTPGPWSGLVDGEGLTYAGSADSVEPVNWKVLTETFLEGLHIGFLHRDTFFPVQYDDLNVVEFEGPYSRVTFPYRNVERLADRDPSTWDVGHRLTYVHSLFPNAVVATFPGQHLLFVLEPEAVDRTRFTTYRFAKGDAAAAASTGEGEGDSLVGRGGAEDFMAARSVQRGLAAGANQVLTFGRHESAIAHFHRHLDAAVEQGATT
jgi:phenylpropionate dioxygenase-like ring-hydroxylating dioxygenase large terminal subunit